MKFIRVSESAKKILDTELKKRYKGFSTPMICDMAIFFLHKMKPSAKDLALFVEDYFKNQK